MGKGIGLVLILFVLVTMLVAIHLDCNSKGGEIVRKMNGTYSCAKITEVEE